LQRHLVVVPTYNERENLPRLVPAILAQRSSFDVLIVDDGSPDGTGRLADQLAAANPRVQVLHRAGKQGLGTAYLAGFRWALGRDYAAVFEMDADFSHQPDDLGRLLAAVEQHDVAIGSRWAAGGGTRGWSTVRTVISRGGSWYARLLLGLELRDLTSGFKCFRREVLATLDLDSVRSNGYAFQVELNYLAQRAGFSIAEVPITFTDRTEGKSKMSWRIVQEAAVRVWCLRQHEAEARSAPRRAASDPLPIVVAQRGSTSRQGTLR
jgi:dolichol-phosphate mannosyltransferase